MTKDNIKEGLKRGLTYREIAEGLFLSFARVHEIAKQSGHTEIPKKRKARAIEGWKKWIAKQE